MQGHTHMAFTIMDLYSELNYGAWLTRGSGGPVCRDQKMTISKPSRTTDVSRFMTCSDMA